MYAAYSMDNSARHSKWCLSSEPSHLETLVSHHAHTRRPSQNPKVINIRTTQHVLLIEHQKKFQQQWLDNIAKEQNNKWTKKHQTNTQFPSCKKNRKLAWLLDAKVLTMPEPEEWTGSNQTRTHEGSVQGTKNARNQRAKLKEIHTPTQITLGDRWPTTTTQYREQNSQTGHAFRIFREQLTCQTLFWQHKNKWWSSCRAQERRHVTKNILHVI